MFDRYTYSRNYNDTRVTEHRAPTDESVRLLKEMEEKAHEKIIESVAVRDTNIECKILISDDMLSDQTRFVVIYSMNGNKQTVKVCVDKQRDIQDKYKLVLEEVANDIACNMLSEAFNKAMK